MKNSPRWLGIVVSGTKITAVEAEVPKSGPIIIQSDTTWTLESGNDGKSYDAMYRRFADYLKQNNIFKVVIKASAASQRTASLSLLASAELRGVAIAAAAATCDVEFVKKASASRWFGARKIDEYIDDDEYMSENFLGKELRRGSREAAILLLINRGGK